MGRREGGGGEESRVVVLRPLGSSFPAILKALAFSTTPLTLVPELAPNQSAGHVETSVA